MDPIPLRGVDTAMTATGSERGDSGPGEERHSRGTSDGESSDGDEEDAHIDTGDKAKVPAKQKTLKLRLFTAFLIFGLLNNVLYVVILSAAIDLVPASVPKGIVAFFNVFPAVLAKVVYPFISRGRIRYGRRVAFCTACSWLGIIIVAFSPGLYPRLFGISMASLSSGLGELTFLQLTTALPSLWASKTALGAWSSGTGFAGIAGAGIWWMLRSLGVKGGLGISSVLPLFFPFTYLFLLPPLAHLANPSSVAYQPLPTSSIPETSHASVVALPDSDFRIKSNTKKVILSMSEKLELLRPLILRYMLALCAVYIEEYVINSGVAPTLVFPLPTTGIWSHLFHSPRDYYPFWSLSYQTFVFLSRSSLSFGFPPIPRALLPLPAIMQFAVLTLLSLQSSNFIFASTPFTPPSSPPQGGSDRSITFVFLLICLEGLFGGAAYVNTFYHVGREGDDGDDDDGDGDNCDVSDQGGVKRRMEREFKMGAVGAADSTGILLASLISMPVEMALCRAQVDKGRTLCRDL